MRVDAVLVAFATILAVYVILKAYQVTYVLDDRWYVLERKVSLGNYTSLRIVKVYPDLTVVGVKGSPPYTWRILPNGTLVGVWYGG